MKRIRSFGRVDLALLLVAALWGLNMPFMKYGMGHMPPLAFNLLRFILSIPTAWLLVLAGNNETKSIKAADLKPLFWIGFAFFAFIWFFTIGLSKTTSGNTAILMGLLPLGVVFWNRVFRVEALSRRMYGGILLSLAGAMIVVFYSGKEISLDSQHVVGDLIVLLAVVANGYFLAKSKALTEKHPPMLVVTYCFTIAFGLLLVVSIPSLLEVDWSSLTMLDYLAIFYCGPVALIITNFLWIWCVSQIGSTRTSVFNNLSPVFAIAGGVFFLGESFGPMMLVGAMVIFSGLYICRTGKIDACSIGRSEGKGQPALVASRSENDW